MQLLNNRVVGVAAGFASIGSVLRGLEGTREGYQLGYSIQHIFFRACRRGCGLRYGSLRMSSRDWQTPLHFLNRRHYRKGLQGQAADKGIKAAFRKFAQRPFSAGSSRNFIHGMTKAAGGVGEKSDNLKPMLTTSFGDVGGLQGMIQKLSTEESMQEP